MTAQLHHLDDYRDKPTLIGLECYRVPLGVAGLYLNAWLRIWQGMAMLAAIPLAMFIRGR